MAMLRKQAICMDVGISLFVIITWIISLIPIIGPFISRTIKWGITKIAVMAGVLNCGFENEFGTFVQSDI
jgi:hypothetical protein